jgi:ketosteroid isomerase-like protein
MKLKMSMNALIASGALFLASCATPAAETEAPAAIDMDALRIEIQAMEDAFAAAEKNKDADGVVVYYAEDAVSYGRNSEPAVGKATIKTEIAEGLAKDSTGNINVYKVVDLFAEGNMAVEIGSWTKMNPAGEVTDRGHYMSYFEKRDGKYVCVRDMNTSSMAPKPAM